ncbi:lariat debranching enzyme, C-terminal domain-containing protein [Sporodiniella umbellata]|nr:lariat debranching enzyme, C-terminal domain-containing protein [Sporodiniella umbellata]
MKIAVEGCCHGELDQIYDSIRYKELKSRSKVDLVLICGDFQAVRNESDLACMAVPNKYKKMGTFWKYYSGQKKAPYPTIFIGGNHEASNHLWELYHGGWVCENIYFLGYASVINFGGVRIGGISGIFKANDYKSGHYETPPYNGSTMRSIYHVREYEVQRMLQVKEPVDVFISHDWPRGIERYGKLKNLINRKRFFEQEVRSNTLGSGPNELILSKLQPAWWFSAHLHVRFEAKIDHNHKVYSKNAQEFLHISSKDEEKIPEDHVPKVTNFLSLDKCLYKREFLEIIDIPTSDTETLDFYYDLEWLSITKAMDKYFSTSTHQKPLPEDKLLQQIISKERTDLEEKLQSHSLDLKIPHNFEMSVPPFNPKQRSSAEEVRKYQQPILNPQTAAFCREIGIENKINIKETSEPSVKRAKTDQASGHSEVVIDDDDMF